MPVAPAMAPAKASALVWREAAGVDDGVDVEDGGAGVAAGAGAVVDADTDTDVPVSVDVAVAAG